MVLLRDNSARAKQAISIFWIMLGVTIINMALLAWQYLLMSDARADREGADMQAIDTSDTLRQVTVIVRIIIIVLSAVFFIMWFRRSYYNLHLVPWSITRYTEGWAAGSWFVPIIWFWWPYQIMMDVWRGTQYAVKERLGEPQPATIVGWWWALYLCSRLYKNFTAVAMGDPTDIDSFITAIKVEFIGEVIATPAILLTIVMIQRTSVFERELLAHAQTPEDSIFSDSYVPPPQESIEPKLEN